MNATSVNENKLNINTMITLQKTFLDNLKVRGRSLNTTKNYKIDLDCFFKYYSTTHGQDHLEKININHIVEFNNFLSEKFNSDNSKRRKIQALRLFFDFLVASNIFQENPVKKLQSFPKFLDIPRPTPFVDIKTLWSHLIEEEASSKDLSKLIVQRNQIIVLMIFGSALKVSEISKLTKDHILLGESPRVLVESRDKDPRTIPLPEIFNTIYPKYIALLEKIKQKFKIEFDNIMFNANAYVISSGGLSARGIQIVFNEYEKKMLILLTPKSLRQAGIINWIHKRYNDSMIKEWLGVTPSYSLGLFKTHSLANIYSDFFLEEMYKNYRGILRPL